MRANQQLFAVGQSYTYAYDTLQPKGTIPTNTVYAAAPFQIDGDIDQDGNQYTSWGQAAGPQVQVNSNFTNTVSVQA